MLATACGGSTAVTEISGPDTPRCQTSLSPTPGTLPSAGTRVTLTVVAARECAWTMSVDASWAQVAPTSGQGEETVTLTVAENPEGRTRTGALVVNDNRLSLTQEAAPCRFDVSPSIIRLSHVGGHPTLNVSATSGCSWRAASNDSWARVLTANGTSSATVEVEVSRNATGAPRSGTLTVANHTVTIDQNADVPEDPRPIPEPGPNPNPPPNPIPTPNPDPPCTVAIEPAERSFNASAAEGTFHVRSGRDCRWNATPAASWINVLGGNGSGDDTIRYRVEANTSTSARAGVITIAGQTHTVRQEGAAPPPDRGEKVNFSGIAFLVDGACPSLQFVVNFVRRVYTDGDTNFKGRCDTIRNGTRVDIDGRLEPDGRIRATKVTVDD